MLAEVQLWAQLLQLGLSAVVVYASFRGYLVWKPSYDAIVASKDAQLEQSEERCKRSEERSEKLEGMLYEALGINHKLIDTVANSSAGGVR